MLNFPFIYNFLEVELRGCDHDLRTMIEHFPLIARYLYTRYLKLNVDLVT